MASNLFERLAPKQLLIYGYSLILLTGFLLLCIPGMQSQSTSVLDNLFVATSALSTTGLSPVDVASSYTFGGELVLLLLIQVGGLGYMSIGSFVVLMRRQKLRQISNNLIQYDFSLPKGFDVRDFIKSMVVFTLVLELIGAVFLALIFKANGEANPIWMGIFHSISAFCTAGFSLFSNGLEGYQSNFS